MTAARNQETETMRTLPSFAAMICTAAVIAAPVLAQQLPAAQIPGTPPANSNLAVASVKLDGGWRASKLIGSSVSNEQGEKIGSVDDLVVTQDNRITTVIVSVGGFLGIGSKLIAVPYAQLRIDQDLNVTMPGATKQALNTMPSFTYGT